MHLNHYIHCFSLCAGRVLLKLGKVQFELQKLVDSYVRPLYSSMNGKKPQIVMCFLMLCICFFISAHILSRRSQPHQSLFLRSFRQWRLALLIFFSFLTGIMTLDPYSLHIMTNN